MTIPIEIEEHVRQAHLAVVDLVEIDFGGGVYRFWANTEVSNEWFATVGFGPDEWIQPNKFEARIQSIGDMLWSLDDEEGSLSLTVAYKMNNYDFEIENLILDYGIDIFENAKVTLHRLFPNLKQIHRSYWKGFGKAPTFQENTFEWDIAFFPGALRQQVGRVLEITCSHVFAGGTGCSYNLERMRGIPSIASRFVAGGGTSNTQLFGNFAGLGVLTSWYAVNFTTNTYAKITSVSDSVLGISIIGSGEGGTSSFVSGNEVIIGPRFETCGKTEQDCIARGRFGPWERAPSGETIPNRTDLIGDKRREFGGRISPVPQTYMGRLPDSGDRFIRSPREGNSIDGWMIPIVFGAYRLYNVPSFNWASAGRFQHGLFILSEGVQCDVQNPMVNSHPHDDGTPRAGNIFDEVKVESFRRWGIWGTSGVEDHRLSEEATVAHTLRVRRGIGQRACVGWNSRNSVIDSYGVGWGNDDKGDLIPGGLPYLFALAHGYGPSLSGMCAAYVRIDTGQDNDSELKGQFDLAGMLTLIPPGIEPDYHIHNRYNVNVEGTTLRFTQYPNNAIVGYNILTNPIWAGGLSDNYINLESVKDLSDFCDYTLGTVSHTTTEFTVGVYEALGDKRSIFTVMATAFGVDIPDNALHGHVIRFHALNYEGIIASNETYTDPYAMLTGGGENVGNPDNYTYGDKYVKIILVHPLPEGMEISGSVTILGIVYGRSTRWRAVGALTKQLPVKEALKLVLQEANANYRMGYDGKIEFVNRRGLTATELETVVNTRLFTDRGIKRNIIRNDDGSTTLRIWRNDITEMANEYSVEFNDMHNNFITTRVSAFSEEGQIEAANRFGDFGDRRRIRKTVQLPLTATIDQSARRLALMIREEYIANLFCSFDTSLNLGELVNPGDIIAIDSAMFSRFIANPESDVMHSSGAYFFRVLKKRESDKFVISLDCQIHVNDIYDDSARMFGDFFLTRVVGYEPRKLPPNVFPHDPVVEHILTDANVLETLIHVKVTYPS